MFFVFRLHTSSASPRCNNQIKYTRVKACSNQAPSVYEDNGEDFDDEEDEEECPMSTGCLDTRVLTYTLLPIRTIRLMLEIEVSLV